MEALPQPTGPAHLRAELQGFGEAPAQKYWLPDWALFMALKGRYGGAAFREWPEELRRREPAALARVERELADDVAWHVFLQFLFFRQWDRVKEAAHARGIRILGDIPIYVSPDSADVWSHPEIFELDEAGDPVRVAGVPPDYFSETGQLWGNPLYRWDVLETERLPLVGRARQGEPAPDGAPPPRPLPRFRRLLGGARRARRRRIDGTLGAGARDGSSSTPSPPSSGSSTSWPRTSAKITPDVTALVEALDLPGMKILQFAFDGDDEDYQPHNHVPNGVVYTGTHDNDTTRGWWEKAGDATRRRVRAYLGGDGTDPIGILVRAAYASVAFLAILPVQDVFGLGSEARMNTPGQGADNWAWRARKWDFNGERAGVAPRARDADGALPAARETATRRTGAAERRTRADAGARQPSPPVLPFVRGLPASGRLSPAAAPVRRFFARPHESARVCRRRCSTARPGLTSSPHLFLRAWRCRAVKR